MYCDRSKLLSKEGFQTETIFESLATDYEEILSWVDGSFWQTSIWKSFLRTTEPLENHGNLEKHRV